MDDESAHPIPPELQVRLDTEVHVEAPISAVEEQNLEHTLTSLPGVVELNFLPRTIAIRYDPESVTRATLCDLITKAGLRVAEVESAPASPALDAYTESVQDAGSTT